MTPLMCAAQAGHKDIVTALIDFGCNVNLQNYVSVLIYYTWGAFLSMCTSLAPLTGVLPTNSVHQYLHVHACVHVQNVVS